MPGTASYLNNEPVWVVFNDVNLGFGTRGDITVTVTNSWVDKHAYQTGDYLLDSYFKGQRITAAVTLSEITNYDSFLVAFPMGEKQYDENTPNNDRFVAGSSTSTDPWTGQSAATSYAAELILRPVAEYVDVSTEETRDVVIPKAFARDVGDILFSIDSDCALSVTFEGLFDETATEGENLWIRGLLTGTWTSY